MKWTIVPAVVLALAVPLVPGAAQDDKAPAVGDKAPDFKLVGTDGKTYTLKQFQGKSTVVVAWYPKALTSGCTAEFNSLRDEKSMLSKYRVQVFGASVDLPEQNKEFSDKNRHTVVLLSDPDKSYAKALGVLNPLNGFASRWTYVIDETGVIRDIDKNVRPGSHGKDLVAKLEALGVPKK